MKKANELDKKLRAHRKELAQRTVNLHVSDRTERRTAKDSPEVLKIGGEISMLIQEEHLEKARERLKEELSKKPNEPMFLNLQMTLDILDKPFGNYEQAKKFGSILMENSIKKDNPYYTMTALNNMGLIAHNEGHDEYSKMMYLAAHFVDSKALGPITNLAGWYSRRKQLEEAQKWVNRILETYPDWLQREEIVTFLKKDESLHNLRTYDPYKKKVMSKIL